MSIQHYGMQQALEGLLHSVLILLEVSPHSHVLPARERKILLQATESWPGQATAGLRTRKPHIIGCCKDSTKTEQQECVMSWLEKLADRLIIP